MGSLVEGGSYCEDQASTKALAGSVICPNTHNNADSKSLCGAKSVCSGITSGGVGDNASVRGLAGSICNGVEPVAPSSFVAATTSVRCSKCHKPVHVTLQVVDTSSLNGGANHDECPVDDNEWRKLSSDSRQCTLETRITKFVDQLSVDSYEIGGGAGTHLNVDDDDADSNLLLGDRHAYRNIEKIVLPVKKMESTTMASRQLTAINEIHACHSSVPVDEQDECLCDDGEVLLLPDSSSILDGGSSSIGGAPKISSASSSSWKFLKKSRSWSAKLDSTRNQSFDKSSTSVAADNNSSSQQQKQLPTVHYKKHSSSWKLKITRRPPPTASSVNPPETR